MKMYLKIRFYEKLIVLTFVRECGANGKPLNGINGTIYSMASIKTSRIGFLIDFSALGNLRTLTQS